jgi:hypothetical protein
MACVDFSVSSDVLSIKFYVIFDNNLKIISALPTHFAFCLLISSFITKSQIQDANFHIGQEMSLISQGFHILNLKG